MEGEVDETSDDTAALLNASWVIQAAAHVTDPLVSSCSMISCRVLAATVSGKHQNMQLSTRSVQSVLASNQ